MLHHRLLAPLDVASRAFNRQILSLEEMGTPLFERLPRGLRPGEAAFARHGRIDG